MLNDIGGAAKGFGGGVWEGVKSTASGLKDLAQGGYTLITNPDAREQAWQTTKQLATVARAYGHQAYDDPAQAWTDAKDGANRLYSAFDKARQDATANGQSAEFWGHAIGRGGFEVVSALAPVGALTKAGKLAEGAEAAGKMVKSAEALKGMSAADRAAAALAKATQQAADAGYEVMPCGKLVRTAELERLSRAETAARVGDTERSIAAQNVLKARNILRDAGLGPADRNEIIRSFDMETLRVEQTASQTTAYRLFDDSTARLEGRYVSEDFFASQTDRIQKFALPANSATRLGEVTIPEGSVVFTGRIAPQALLNPGLTGGANQMFLTGPLSKFSYREVLMPR